MNKKGGRYSYLIRPTTAFVDLVIINLSASLCFNTFGEQDYLFHLILSLGWIISAMFTSFYDVYRHTRTVNVIEKICKQFIAQVIFISAYNGLFERFAEPKGILVYVVVTFTIIAAIKFSIFFLLKHIRKFWKGNFRCVLLLGDQQEIEDLNKILVQRSDLGFRIYRFKIEEEGNLDALKTFSVNHTIDEIFMPFSATKENSIVSFLEFADSQMINVAYVPSQKEIIKNNLSIDYVDLVPIVYRRKIPLDKPYNILIKRIFDLVFSLLVIIFILSWLIPLLAILIKKESKGPVFFKQKRTGLGDEEFWCYKFRSMTVNTDSDKQQATKHDVRITKIGAFMRKTSLDEFPQFINVFLGNMSIVGPRPHMVVHTKMYSKRVNRFMLRHLVKPGITGMAQTHGYRGEIETDRDIVNRFKYDLFYLENWSIILDLKIIYLTVYNVFKGEEKAY